MCQDYIYKLKLNPIAAIKLQNNINDRVNSRESINNGKSYKFKVGDGVTGRLLVAPERFLKCTEVSQGKSQYIFSILQEMSTFDFNAL